MRGRVEEERDKEEEEEDVPGIGSVAVLLKEQSGSGKGSSRLSNHVRTRLLPAAHSGGRTVHRHCLEREGWVGGWVGGWKRRRKKGET